MGGGAIGGVFSGMFGFEPLGLFIFSVWRSSIQFCY